MQIFKVFWVRLAGWTGILLGLLLLVTTLSGAGIGAAAGNLPGWAGMALALAAFPAGLAVSNAVFPDRWMGARPLVHLLLAAGSVVIVAFLLAGYLGPAVQQWLSSDRIASVETDDLRSFTIGELVRGAREARAVADASGSASVSTWLPVNRLVWHLDMRVAASLLPFLFAWVGSLVGFWTRLTPRADLRQAQHWTLGLGLVFATYRAGENSYEWIVLHTAGFLNFPAGYSVLVLPGLLVLGLAWPAALTLWHRHATGESS